MIDKKTKIIKTIHERFLKFTFPEPNTGCWLFAGEPSNDYGRIRINGVNISAHRYSYEYYNNTTIPDGLFVCHRCNMPPCVNPDHLYVGTNSQNMIQCKSDGRLPPQVYEPKSICKLTIDGELIEKFDSIASAARTIQSVRFTSAASSIALVCGGIRKTMYGFIWEFENNPTPYRGRKRTPEENEKRRLQYHMKKCKTDNP